MNLADGDLEARILSLQEVELRALVIKMAGDAETTSALRRLIADVFRLRQQRQQRSENHAEVARTSPCIRNTARATPPPPPPYSPPPLPRSPPFRTPPRGPSAGWPDSYRGRESASSYRGRESTRERRERRSRSACRRERERERDRERDRERKRERERERERRLRRLQSQPQPHPQVPPRSLSGVGIGVGAAMQRRVESVLERAEREQAEQKRIIAECMRLPPPLPRIVPSAGLGNGNGDNRNNSSRLRAPPTMGPHRAFLHRCKRLGCARTTHDSLDGPCIYHRGASSHLSLPPLP